MTIKLRTALEIARDLTEPGEINNEYVRGQVNLISDLFGLPGDDYGDLITEAIGHTMTIDQAMSAMLERSIEIGHSE